MRIRNVGIAVVSAMMSVTHGSLAYGQLRESQTTRTSVGGIEFEVTTGFVQVPESRDASVASSRHIELAVVVMRRPNSEGSRDANVVLAGGPGESGVNLVLGLLKQGAAAVWPLFDGDIVGIDQRGIGRSRPNLETPARFDLPLDEPGSIETWIPRMERVSREVASDFRGRGIRLEAYNTQESADDVRDVLKTLGYARATFWGRSYGTHLALAVLARHPEIARRLVLISPEGPDHTWKSPMQVQRVIDELVNRGATDIATNLRAVLDRLREQPVRVTVNDPMTGKAALIAFGAFDVQWIVSQALGDSRLVRTLPAALREMAAGRFEQIAQIAMLRRTRTGVQSAMKAMMDLSSGASAERRRQIDDEAPRTLLGNAINFPLFHLQDAWEPVKDLGEVFRRPARSNAPVLMLVGDLDPRTPIANATEIAATLPRSQTVVVKNGNHDFDVFGSSAIRDVIARFLRGDQVPGEIVLPNLVFQ